jgi:hypothetical protein
MVAKTEITPAGNSRFAKLAVLGFYDSEVLHSNFSYIFKKNKIILFCRIKIV